MIASLFTIIYFDSQRKSVVTEKPKQLFLLFCLISYNTAIQQPLILPFQLEQTSVSLVTSSNRILSGRSR